MSCVAARRSSAARQRLPRWAATLLLAAVSVALAACGVGFGAGSKSGKADLLVSRDFGAERLVEVEGLELLETDTVMRILDRNAEVETRYGGGFVNSINGLTGGEGSRPVDWFYFVNGVEADRGSTDYRPLDGDRIWWDFRDWGAAMRVPAVVGHYPEPFINGYGDGQRPLTAIECREAGPICEEVESRLTEAGAEVVSGDSPSGNVSRVIVGAWQDLEDEWPARAISRGPEFSGVHVRVEEDEAEGRVTFVALDTRGTEVGRYQAGNGLIAASRQGERPPVWLITGTDDQGLRAAVAALDEDRLHGSFALLISPAEGDLPLPRP